MVDSREGGRCDGQNHITATLRDFTAWNKEIGELMIIVILVWRVAGAMSRISIVMAPIESLQ